MRAAELGKSTKEMYCILYVTQDTVFHLLHLTIKYLVY